MDKVNIKDIIPKLKSEQEKIGSKIIETKLKRPIKTIAGCDSAFKNDYIISVFVIFDFNTLKEIETVFDYSKVNFPYISGFLSFRELPNLLETYKKIKNKPDLIMVDENGIIHPRRAGIATHLGVTLNVPTIGVAKNKLYGKCEMPGKQKGSFTYVKSDDEILGIALRSKDNIKPIYISLGHLCDLETAHKLVIKTLIKHKLPEPTRIADLYAEKFKVEIK